MKRTDNSKITLKKNNKVGELILPDLVIHYKTNQNKVVLV